MDLLLSCSFFQESECRSPHGKGVNEEEEEEEDEKKKKEEEEEEGGGRRRENCHDRQTRIVNDLTAAWKIVYS
jgi:hypothetical protein